MTELQQESRMSPQTLFALTIVVVSLGFLMVGPLIGFFLAIPFFEGSLTDQVAKMGDPTKFPEFRLPLYIMQGAATFIGLAVLPSLFWFATTQQGFASWFKGHRVYGVMVAVTAVLTIAFMVTNSVFIDWNANVKFPDAMSGFETWAREFEDRAEVVMGFMTKFSSTSDFLVAFVVIAVLPAVGEEFVFRGLIQTQLVSITKSTHLAIWIAAILFSAFHLQFFGFVPRVLLGALFGYLYQWSGNLLMPMIAHFVNNGFSVIMLYLFQQGVVKTDLDTTDAAPWPVVLIFTLIGAGLLYYYRNFCANKNAADGQQ